MLIFAFRSQFLPILSYSNSVLKLNTRFFGANCIKHISLQKYACKITNIYKTLNSENTFQNSSTMLLMKTENNQQVDWIWRHLKRKQKAWYKYFVVTFQKGRCNSRFLVVSPLWRQLSAWPGWVSWCQDLLGDPACLCAVLRT